MKSILISLLLFLSVNAQNVWYVNRDATGGNTGRSWTDAWTSVDSGGWTGVSTGINWHIIGDGDTIYISGGTDSTVYLPPTNYGSGVYRDYTTPSDIITFNETVIVAPAWQTGHNGTVYFSSRNNNNQVVFRVQYISNVTFDGGINKRFHLIDERDAADIPLLNWSGLIQLGNGDHGDLDSLITLKNWNIYSRNLTDIIGVQGAKNKIIDCIIDQESNHYASSSDPIGVNIGRGGHTIDGNTIISRNYYESTGGTANASVTVGSNFLRDTRLSMTTNYYSDSYATVGYTENDTAYNMIVTSNDNNTFYGDWDVFITGTRTATTNYPTQQGLAWGTDDPHKDIIQFSDYGFGELLGGIYATERLPTTVSNNLIVNTSAIGTGWNALLYSSNPRCHSSFYVYNNIFASAGDGSTNTPIVVYQPDTTYHWNFSHYIINNTIILNSATGSNNLLDLTGDGNLGVGGVDTTIVKNNLLIADIDFNIWLNLRIMFYPYFRDFDYNYYADPDDILSSDPFYMGEGFGGATLTRWRDGYETNPPYDVHSYWEDSDNTTFVEKYGTDISDYYTTTGRDLGINLLDEYPFLRYDILGNERKDGVWDIGALEFPTTYRNAVLLTHSSGSRLYDYDAYMGTDSTDISVPLEMDAYNTANGYTGDNEVQMQRRWFPTVYGTDWYNWLNAFNGTIDDGSDLWAKLDTFNVIVFKGGIQTTQMTGYGSASDTTEENFVAHSTDKTTIMYKHIWRMLIDSMANHPDKFWVIMTGAACPERFQTTNGAQLSHEFAIWAKDTLAMGLDAYGTFPDNIYVFDYFHYLADASYNLKPEYEIPAPAEDFHQNAYACDVIAPIFVDEIFDAAIAYEGVIPETPADTTCNLFSFTAVNDADLNTLYTSNENTLAGIDEGEECTIWITGGEYNINGGGFTSITGTIGLGDTFRVRRNSHATLYETPVSCTLYISDKSGTYTITTENAPSTPGQGGWAKQPNGRGIYDRNGVRIITR